MASAHTIVALASGKGAAGVAVIRASGPAAHAGLKALLNGVAVPEPRLATRAKLYTPNGTLLDDALVLVFKAPNSFTGEDVVEYHTHGGRAVVEAVINALLALPDHRMALAGEYTRRAFENGRMDLTAAEAVADLVHAETEAQRVQALHQMGGALAHLYDGWAHRLKRVLAHTEADLDFVDEHDVPDGLDERVKPEIQHLCTEVQTHLADGRRGERLRDGIKIAIIGAPNAGKSTLVNALAARDVAIVSPVAGTTRDVVEVHLDLGGYPVIVADTAGLRPEYVGTNAHDDIEKQGMERALKWAEQADILVVAVDAQDGPTLPPAIEKLLQDTRAVPLITKAEFLKTPTPYAAISIAQNTGVDAFLKTLTTRVADIQMPRSDTPPLTRARHRQALEDVVACLTRALTAPAAELAAEDVRLAMRALGSITGKVHVEDVLDVIFRDFCIGK